MPRKFASAKRSAELLNVPMLPYGAIIECNIPEVPLIQKSTFFLHISVALQMQAVFVLCIWAAV